MNLFLIKIKPLAPVIVRIGMSAVFLYFSYCQFTDPSIWTGFIPDPIAAIFGGNAAVVVLLNAWFELVAGLCLLAGFQTRTVSFLLALHLFGIAGTIGISPLGVRDLGLAVATLSITFAGYDMISFDRKFVREAAIEAGAEDEGEFRPVQVPSSQPIRQDQNKQQMPRRI